MDKLLSIRLYGEVVGVLKQNDAGKMSFMYDEKATTPISIGMPIQQEPFTNEQCEAFFGGLLPESALTRKQIAGRFRINENNSFALLKAIGHDCAGAISCFEINDPIISQHAVPLAGRILSENELYENIMELPKKPLFIGLDGLRLSLAGVHDKAAVCLIDNQIAIPEGNCPSTHILKPASKAFEGLVENEYFCLQMASTVGLCIPENKIRMIKNIPYLLIERYDRRIAPDNLIERIHQEDFCQAHGLSSIRKYQNDGGPGLQQCFALLNEVAQPAIDRNMLANAIIFNFLIGNMDAHSKNFSLLQTKPSRFSLAPFYDIVCTRVYRDLSTKMAMKIGSKYDVNEVFPRHWQELCTTVNYSYPALKNLIKKQGESLLHSLDWNKEFFDTMTNNASIISKIIEEVKKHINKTLERFEKSD